MNKRWVLVGAATLALSGIGASSTRAADKEENEQKISFKEAPAAVRKTLKREANGQKIKTVDKEKLNGKTVYEADVEIDDHNYEIVVDPKGLLLSKKLDKKADEDETKSHVKKASKDKEEDEDDAKSEKKEKKDKESDKAEGK